jgi:3-methyl-2-oxobutanoate hydroxymethyltransferase
MTTPTSARVTVPAVLESKSNRKLSALTAYDYTFARLLDGAGIDIILVGDSLGSVIQGHETTLPVTLDEVIYHCRCVTRGVKRALVVGDMPFMSYQVSPEQAILSGGRLIKEGGVAAVKLEGGVHVAETIKRLVQIEIPVMGHIGLTPQAYHRMGGHKVQGRTQKGQGSDHAGSIDRVLADAVAVEEAGAFAVVLEGIPLELANEITAKLKIPTIGIGAGLGCDGQILVSYDLLGLGQNEPPRFVKQYCNLADQIKQATSKYISEVQSEAFPDDAHSFHLRDGRGNTLKLAKS